MRPAIESRSGDAGGSVPTPSRYGMSLVEVLVVVGIMAVLIAIAIPAISAARAAAYRAKCRHNLRQVGIALHHFHATNSALPPGCSFQRPDEPMPHLSWLARLLPFVEHEALWLQTIQAFQQERFFRRNPPHAGLDKVIPLFFCPLDAAGEAAKDFRRFKVAYTSYLGVEGLDQTSKDGLLYLNSGVRLADCSDGTANSLLVGERPPSADGVFGWWYAGWGQSKDGSADMVLGARELRVHRSFLVCPETANRFGPGLPGSQCDALHFWSPHLGGAHFLFGDGSVRLLTYSADATLPALATRAGGEAVELP